MPSTMSQLVIPPHATTTREEFRAWLERLDSGQIDALFDNGRLLKVDERALIDEILDEVKADGSTTLSPSNRVAAAQDA